MADWGLIGQAEATDLLESALQAGRLPHALLLAGPEGTGKATAAHAAARRLLCREGAGAGPCGQCPPCRHVTAGTAGDLTVLEAGPGEELRIDTVREAGQAATLTPLEAHRRVVIIDPAEALNDYAANALLKLLEEPPGPAVFLLVSHRPDRLLATIRSRCQTIPFRPVPPDLLEAWLGEQVPANATEAPLAARLAGGAPGKALAWADRSLTAERDAVLRDLEAAVAKGGEPLLRVAAAWGGAEPGTWLPFVTGWLRDMARVKVSGPNIPAERLVNADRRSELAQAVAAKSFKHIDRLRREGEELVEQVTGRRNTQLALEAFLAGWAFGPEEA